MFVCFVFEGGPLVSCLRIFMTKAGIFHADINRITDLKRQCNIPRQTKARKWPCPNDSDAFKVCARGFNLKFRGKSCQTRRHLTPVWWKIVSIMHVMVARGTPQKFLSFIDGKLSLEIGNYWHRRGVLPNWGSANCGTSRTHVSL